MRRLLSILAFLALTTQLYSQTKPKTNLFLETLNAAPGDQVCIDLTVTDFRFIEALGLSIRWDTSALKFTEYIISPTINLIPSSLNVLDDDGILLMAWTIIPALTLPDTSLILQLCFAVKETNLSQFAYITFDEYIPAEVIVSEEITGDPFVDAVFHSGGIQIKPIGNEVTIAAQTVAFRDCLGLETTIDLTVSGGAPPYNFEWAGPNGFVSITEDLEQPSEGFYEVLVYDQNGLQAIGRFLINVLENESENVRFIEEATVTPTDCNVQEGSIQLNMIGEATDYTYRWNNGALTPNLFNLPSGDYLATITDSRGCEQIADFAVKGTGNIIYNQVNNRLNCDGSSAKIGVLLPQPEIFFFEWNTGDFTPLIDVHQSGPYTLALINGAYCVERIAFNVEYDVSTFDLDWLEADHLSCGEGKATIGVENINLEDYYISWPQFESTDPLITVNQPGTYTLEIHPVDIEGCTQEYTFEVGPPEISTAIFYECPGASQCADIVIGVETIGAVTPVTFSWSTGQVDTMANGVGKLSVNNRYPVSVQIQDAGGCTTSLDNIIPLCPEEHNEDLRLRTYFTCEEEEQGLVTYIHAEVLSGGNPPYYFSWNNNVQDTSYFLSRLPFDNTEESYIVAVKDQSGRQAQWSFNQTDLYGCGPDSSAVYFEAPHMIVAPGSQFVYPVRIHQNFDNLARSLFTIDWDNCLLEADSIVMYYPTRMTYTDLDAFGGSYEIYFQDPKDTILPDTVTICDIFFRTGEQTQGISPFLLSTNEPAYYDDGETAFLRPLHGSITVASEQAFVLPGDADHNYSVNHFDLLNLGLFYQGAGPDRRLGLLQEQEYAIPWLRQTYQSHLNLKHLDCNGDGLINAQDTNVIAINWDVSNLAFEKFLPNEEGPSVFIAGDTLFPGERQDLSIHLGEMILPAIGVYGIALTIDYEEDVVLPESVSVDFSESWFATNSVTPALVISRNDPLHHRIHLAIVRTDGLNVTGYGELSKLHLNTRPGTEKNTATFTITDVQMINTMEQILPTNHQTSFLTIDQMTTTRQPELASFIRLYPVPAQDRLFIHHPAEISLLQAEIFDLAGRRMQERHIQQNQFDVTRLPTGIYFLKLVTNKGMITKRWVKI